MKVWFLGTGTSQGIPVIGCDDAVCRSTDMRDKRLRVSVWVHWDNYSYIIDCGPDFRQQMLASQCPKVDGILYTHEHSDHTAGLDDIRPFFFKQGDIPVYVHERVLKNLHKRFDYIFTQEDKYPGAPSVTVNEVKAGHAFPLGDKIADPISIKHGDLDVFGYRIGDFAYLTDIKYIAPEEAEKLKELKVLVVSALRHEPHDTHYNLEEALALVSVLKPERAYLTHISHHMGLHAEVEKMLPANVFLAYDNLEITI
ncbi:MBL fold metallo-hydrolase [Flavobacterium album]|uniref:MBL fold metallo-hydrolase n=1 Tax=Flavobacterium album TaxID=2175091 RepID=A0A2S1QZR9_9FLAO|nr:MBL fold metallo-hydrolase [Flavobacterium album]AWH85927.1 MBL fold metallo-hydrolase [Flavobacterium album]